ncbi:MAG: segregation/condensation protein A [Myxococcales bacterium]|nr:segregation/condensation protein A [Myxococcales bacterium]
MSLSESRNTSEPDSNGAATNGLGASANYGVKLPVFEGPLDLLLHLIRQNEVDIIDISVSQIAEQYIEYLDVMQSLDLDVAAEYLVMAATLAHIKSRMLLPPTDEELEDDGIDPRAELVARLLEYQRYKEVAEALGDSFNGNHPYACSYDGGSNRAQQNAAPAGEPAQRGLGRKRFRPAREKSTKGLWGCPEPDDGPAGALRWPPLETRK